MNDLTLILLAAGESRRFDMQVKKQWLRIGTKPLWQFVADRLILSGHFDNVVIVAHPDECHYMQQHGDYHVVEGGNSRQQSLKNALDHVSGEFVMVSDIARGCIDERMILHLIDAAGNADCVVPALNVHDTVVYKGNTIDRNEVMRIQTPQLSNTAVLRKALQQAGEFTDESSAIVAAGGKRIFVEGEEGAAKLTTFKDIARLECLESPSSHTLTGNGFDVHAFDTEGTMVLGGITIDNPFGFKAHSDGDVAIHALIDALLGAAGMGDIGMHFPDSDEAYKGIDSKTLLKTVVAKLHQYGFGIVNADVTIAAQTPRLAGYKMQMRKVLAGLLHIDPIRMNVKATTTESLGFIGRKEGIGVYATATLYYFDWTKS